MVALLYSYISWRGGSLETKVLKDALAIYLLLNTHACGSEHSKSSVGDFPVLHVDKTLSILGLEAKGVKSNISGVVVLPQRPERTKSRLDPSPGCTKCLGNVDGKEEREEHSSRNLRDLVVGNCVVHVHAVGDGRRGLSNKVSDSGHHGNASVHNLSLSQTLRASELDVLGESKRVEETKRSDGSGQAVERLVLIGSPAAQRSQVRMLSTKGAQVTATRRTH